MSGYKYAHMCRDGHVQIGHNDSSKDERCPWCRDRDSLLAVLRKCVDAMDDANVYMEGEWGSTHIALDDALAAAREKLEGEKA